MKKLISISLTLTMALGLAACGDTSMVDNIAIEQGAAPAETEAPAQTEAAAENDYLSYFLDSSNVETEPPQALPYNTDGALEDPDSYPVPDPDGEFDVDLTTMSSTIVYATVQAMMNEPDKYLGKTVKMRGNFAYYVSEEGKEYFAVIIQDATACCAQGIEFILDGDKTYPEDYPHLDDETTVVGVFDYYMEDYMMYIRLDRAMIVDG